MSVLLIARREIFVPDSCCFAERQHRVQVARLALSTRQSVFDHARVQLTMSRPPGAFCRHPEAAADFKLGGSTAEGTTNRATLSSGTVGLRVRRRRQATVR